MRIRTSIAVNIDADGDEELEQQILDIVQQELMKYSAAVADRLEEEGIDNVEIDIEGDR
jgi:hypothetical protein